MFIYSLGVITID